MDRKQVKRVVLETSLKPFRRMDQVVIELDGKPVDVSETGGTSGGKEVAGAKRLQDRVELHGITGVLSVNW